MAKTINSHFIILCFTLLILNFINSSFASSNPEISYISHHHHHKNKDKIGVYELKKKNISVKLTNFGASLISVFLPDKHGKVDDVVLGYNHAKEYVNDKTYFGALVGRVANRIADAQFTYHGKTYKLVPNDGNNTLHGGPKGFSNVLWKVDEYQPEGVSPFVTFSYFSPDGEEGFPGDLKVTVTYRIIEGKHLIVFMQAKPLNKPTPVNLAQHTYWNLGGQNSGTIFEHEVQIFASHITPVDDELIPTGKLEKVEGTPFDFRKPRTVGSRIKEVPKGFDINYALDIHKTRGPIKPVAIVSEKKSGRVMELFANQPGVQFYTGNMLNKTIGKEGSVYGRYGGLCLETQGFPDAVNHPNFPSMMVAPGETYQHYMFYKFSTKKR